MKSLPFISILILISGCSEKKAVKDAPAVDEEVHADYDTIAIDSFSPGATSAAVEARMRQAAIIYADSVSQVRKDQEHTVNKKSEDAAAKSVQNGSTSAKTKTNSAIPENPQQNP